jgi:uncharacterized protein
LAEDFLIFFAVGFLAQLVDGALGMAYGVTSATALLAIGVPPAHVSAATHTAKLFTTAASGASHIWLKNVDWAVFRRLAPAGMAGGALGVFAVTGIEGALIRPFLIAYLAVMGVYIIWRAWRPSFRTRISRGLIAPLGAGGGFADGIGGGGWGPVVTTTLVGAGEEPRYVVGTVNTAEFFVTVAVLAGFLAALLTGHWETAKGFTAHAAAVAGLIAGGLCAAPLAALVTRYARPRLMAVLVGCLILTLCGVQAAQLAGVL